VLRSLSIRDFVIVDRLELEFASGFTVLTGETGAGKSILIDALTMVLGERAEPIVVRAGAERAEASAEFEAGGGRELERWLKDNGLAGDDGRLLMRRVIESSGRSRGFINGRAATLAQLREAGEFLVDIHGQHQHQSLLRAGAQRELLDAYGDLADVAARVARLYRDWRQRRDSRVALEANAAALGAEREQLEWQVRELEALKLRADEWPELTAEHSRLAHAASLIEAAQLGVDALSEGEASSLARLSAIAARLGNLVEHDARLKAIVELLGTARIQLDEAVHELRRYGERLDLDPRRLREADQRIEAIHNAARKFRVQPEALPSRLESMRARLRELGPGGDMEALQKLEDESHAACLAEARKLSSARKLTARKLSEQVTSAMQDLAMGGGRFDVALNVAAELSAQGLESVEFRVAVHKGVTPQPLAKVASGGELSRLSLAVQAATSRVAQVPTLIFDEVDAGIGGRVAEIVGRMLKELGSRHQVMCITHLPQVAARADHQWQVAKNATGGNVLSTVTVLDAGQRVAEIARMLGGVQITDTTRRHAAEMLGIKNPPAARVTNKGAE
jgi:DNA repair protein RecN (Recombination protein N)